MNAASRVYLDYNASAPLRPEAKAAVVEALGLPGNASSVHGFGRQARRVVEDAREAVAGLVNATPAQVIFTSGGTEANNLALTGAPAERVLASAGEHPSVLNCRAETTIIPLDAAGCVDLAALKGLLANGRPGSLVSVMLANNETGLIQQALGPIVALARAAGALVHCDAVQAPGRLPVDFAALDIDYLSLSAHKIGGPQGAGALIAKAGSGLGPLLRGGGQERGLRAGTENVAAIAGFGAAARAVTARAPYSAPLAAWRDRFEAELKASAPEVVIIGEGSPRLANTCCFALPGLPAETQVMALDLDGVAVSAGAACSSGKVKTSHVLRAMGCDAAVAGSAIRVSLGWQSQERDLPALLQAWYGLYRRWRQAA